MTDNGFAGGIFDQDLFGRRGIAADEELMDHVEKRRHIDADGRVRDYEQELRVEREQRQRRQRMLIIERFVDELPESWAWTKKKLFGVSDESIWGAAGGAAARKAESYMLDAIGRVAERVYRERVDRRSAKNRLDPEGSFTVVTPNSEPSPQELPFDADGDAIRAVMRQVQQEVRKAFDKITGRAVQRWAHPNGSVVEARER